MDKVLSLFGERSYQDVFPRIEPMAECNLFIALNSLDIIVPVIERTPPAINIFEETVLRFLALNKGYKAESISEMMCVDKEFVLLLLMRLIEFGFIDKNYCLTEQGQSIVNNRASASVPVASESCVNAHLLALKGTNEFLSYIRVGEIKGERVTFQNEKNMGIGFGSAGREQKNQVRGPYINEKNYQTPKITQNYIRQTLSRYNRLCKSGDYKSIPFLDGCMIDFTKGPDLILHCKAIIQKGYSEAVLVSDGFTAGSDILTKYINEKYPFVRRTLQENAANRKDAQDIGDEEQPEIKYAEIRGRLGRTRSEGEDHDELREAARNDRSDMQDLVMSIEWALHYVIEQNGVSDGTLNVMKAQSPEENREMLRMMARRLGINFTADDIYLISNLDHRRITAYLRSGNPACYTVLPLAIASAVENGGGVARLGAHMPDFPKWLWKLNLLGGKFRHETGGDDIPRDVYNGMMNCATEFVQLLLPDFSLEESSGERIMSGASQRRLNASVRLSRDLGWELFERLDEGLKDELIQISPDKNPSELPPPREYVLCLSKILENVLAEIETKRNWADRDQVIAAIEQQHCVKIPDGIAKMDKKYFVKAMNGRKTTLNGHLFAFLYGASPERAKPLLELGLISTVSKIGKLRGHASNVGLVVDPEELSSLRQTVFEIIKTAMR